VLLEKLTLAAGQGQGSRTSSPCKLAQLPARSLFLLPCLVLLAVLCRGNGFMPLHHGLLTSFTVNGLRSGVVYKFRVRAENSVRARGVISGRRASHF
jgi:hypothetical protein